MGNERDDMLSLTKRLSEDREVGEGRGIDRGDEERVQHVANRQARDETRRAQDRQTDREKERGKDSENGGPRTCVNVSD